MNRTVAPARRNAAATRARILAAAEKVFARAGYADAGIREIAATAQVDSALVGRYFGSKAGLFEAALVARLNFDEAVPRMGADRAAFGRTMAERLIREDADIYFPLATMASEDPEARAISERVLQEIVLPPMMRWFGGPDARARAFNMVILTTGFALHVRQMRRAGGGSAIDPVTVAWFADSVQAIVDQSPARLASDDPVPA